MAKMTRFLSSFRLKVALMLIVCLFFVAMLGNFFIYKFAFDTQFNQLRDKLKVIAQTAALAIDGEELLKVPLNREGINSPAYRTVVEKLIAIKQANFGIRFIYTMAKTDEEMTLQFIVDPDALIPRAKIYEATSYPGDKYDATQFPEMLKAFNVATADKKVESDRWGSLLSGYAPVRDRQGRVVAILGVDITANDVYLAQKAIVQRGALVLLLGIIFSLVLGIFVSKRITDPVGQLVEGTRHISAGDLNYQVKVKGHDEISELAGAFNNMTDSLLKANKKMHDYFYRAMQSMVRILEAKDPYTKGHSDRVAEFTEKIARQIGLPPAKIDLLKQAAQLHDIGKLSIDERILNKCSALSEEERKIIHEHSRIGEDILRPAAFDKELLELVRSHHEHYDGSGYPDSLKGGEIDLSYQIIPVADAYDAMISSRAYRPPMSSQAAIAILKENSGTQFNPKVVEAFLKTLS